MLSYPSHFIIIIISSYIYIFFIWYSFIVFAQAIQEVFVAEEWVKDARNDAKVKANLHAEANKALGASEQKNKELTTKLIAEERVRMNAEAGLKNAQDQAKRMPRTRLRTNVKGSTILR